jgi:uncharacterized membrane protein
MSERGDGDEGKPGVSRVEAFSDGVIAIIVTIMVLELHAPAKPGWGALIALWPVFVAYLLSYVYVAIYWINHHRLFSHATEVSNNLVWSNMALLFTLSLVPFSTAYLGEQHFSRDATLLYLASVLLPSLSYAWLQSEIRRRGKQGEAAEHYYATYTRKGVVASLIYASGIPLSFVSPALGIATAVVVAILWCLPHSPVDRLFEV